MRHKELLAKQLKNTCDYSTFPFETTADVVPFEGILGQERAVKAMQFGLTIRKHGYNIFITGYSGTGRNSYARSLVEKVASWEKVPDDWCYLYNFTKPDQPQAVPLPAGTAVALQEDMEDLIKEVTVNIPKVLGSQEYGKAKTIIIQGLQEQQNQLLETLGETAKNLGFSLKNTEKGLVSIPLDTDGTSMDEEKFQKLNKEEAKVIDEKSKKLNLTILDVVKRLRDLEKEAEEKVEKTESQFIMSSLAEMFQRLQEEYREYPKVTQYLTDVQKDILQNAKEFRVKEDKNPVEMLILRENRSKDFFHKYVVNVLVDNSKTVGTPVITESNPTYYNLVGKMEYDAHMGVLTTDFTKIKAGALHRANGGYLILQCNDVLTNIFSWNALKRCLKNGQLYMENISEQTGVIPSSSLKPDPIPLKVKIIMVGSYREYQILYQYDEDFRKLFKIRADFDVEMERTQDTVYQLARFINNHCVKEKMRHFTKQAVARVVELSSRLTANQEKLSTKFNEIVEILFEADTWAELDGVAVVDEKHIVKAIKEKIYRSNKYEMKLQEMIEKGVILLDIEGRVVGQVNGLAVLDAGEYAFGKPSRITVNTYMGQKGIVNIEREARLSGSIHDKGILILNGYLGEKFGTRCPLSFSASICFEQLYDGIDGDSASSAELYGLLSSLSGIPVKQNIAVTGSVNQKGFVQPIGGVNQKIEGFFQVCKAKGLTGQQGVMIPTQNVVNLMLDDEVIEAVKQGLFHIYAVSAIEEGIEILTDTPYKAVMELAEKRLREIHRHIKDDEKEDRKHEEAK